MTIQGVKQVNVHFWRIPKNLALINGALTQSVKPYVWKVTFIGQKRQ